MKCKKQITIEYSENQLSGFQAIHEKLTKIIEQIQTEAFNLNPEKFNILELLYRQHEYAKNIGQFKEYLKVIIQICSYDDITSDEFKTYHKVLTENEFNVLNSCVKLFYNDFLDWFSVDELVDLSKMVCGYGESTP